MTACASVDMVGAYRLSRQDYRAIDPAFWRAAALHPDGVTVRAVDAVMRPEDGPARTIRFAEAAETDGRGLPSPGAGERLSVFAIAPDRLGDARALQAAMSGDREPGEFSVSVSLAFSDEFTREFCEGRALTTPVWVRFDPENSFRRILKPEGLDQVMRAAYAESCAQALAE